MHKAYGNINSENRQGVERLTINFNGSIPGPPITADWGDDGKFDTNMHDLVFDSNSIDRLTLWQSDYLRDQQLGIQWNSNPLARY